MPKQAYTIGEHNIKQISNTNIQPLKPLVSVVPGYILKQED